MNDVLMLVKNQPRGNLVRLLAIFVLGIASSEGHGQTVNLTRADSLMNNFAYAEAARVYDMAEVESFVQLEGLATAENMLGMDFMAAGRKDSAEAHFNLAVRASDRMAELFPDSAQTHFSLAAAYGNLALFKGGKAKVRIGRDVEKFALRAVEIDPDYSDALTVLGVFYREVAKLSWIERLVARALFGGLPPASLEQSEDYLRQAVKADSSSPFATFELGQTLIAMKRFDEAFAVYERLQGLAPRNSENARNLKIARAWMAERDN